MKWIFMLAAVVVVVSCGGGPTGSNGSFDSITATFTSDATQIHVVSTPQNTTVKRVQKVPSEVVVIDTTIVGVRVYERFRATIDDSRYFTLPELIPDTIGTSEGLWETTMRFDLRNHSVTDRSMPGDPALLDFYNEVFELANELE